MASPSPLAAGDTDRLNIRKAAAGAAPFVRRVLDTSDDWLERSSPILGIGHTTYGTDGAKRVQRGDLASRTDANGDVGSYPPDDPEVLAKFFRIDLD